MRETQLLTFEVLISDGFRSRIIEMVDETEQSVRQRVERDLEYGEEILDLRVRYGSE